MITSTAVNRKVYCWLIYVDTKRYVIYKNFMQNPIKHYKKPLLRYMKTEVSTVTLYSGSITSAAY